MTSNIMREDGVAVVVASMVTLLMGALGSALILTTMAEAAIATNFQRNSEATYAAEGAIERALSDLLTLPDWTPALNGSRRSGFADGALSGGGTFSDGSTVDPVEVANLANCAKATTCSGPEMDAVTADRPWGRNNPRWQAYAYGWLDRLGPEGAVAPAFYVVVLVGDDPAENDDNPGTDGGAPANGEPLNSGAGVLTLRSEAFGAGGTHAQVELTVARSVRVLSWRKVR